MNKSFHAILFLALIVASSVYANEPNWKSFDGLLLDDNNIIRTGPFVRIWTTSQGSVQFIFNGYTVRSHKTYTEIDCPNMTQKLISDLWYDGPYGTGIRVPHEESGHSDHYDPIEPGSYPFAKIVDYVCNEER